MLSLMAIYSMRLSSTWLSPCCRSRLFKRLQATENTTLNCLVYMVFFGVSEYGARNPSLSCDTGTLMRSNLYQHQKDIVTWARDRMYSAIFAEMGTGKALMAVELLEGWKKRGCLRLLKSSPYRTAAAGSSLCGLVPLKLSDSNLAPVQQYVSDLSSLIGMSFVVNIEALRTFADVIAPYVDIILIDESQIIKNRRGPTDAKLRVVWPML